MQPGARTIRASGFDSEARDRRQHFLNDTRAGSTIG
jgi:hypothetical protein